MTVTEATIEAINARAADVAGVHSSALKRDLRAALVLVQVGACHWCARPFTDADGAEVDRLATGADRGRCSGSRQCADRCRCGYVPGAIVAAHAACHRSLDAVAPAGREGLSEAAMVRAIHAAPTASEVTSARRASKVARATADAPVSEVIRARWEG